jgi:hypothetical protein
VTNCENDTVFIGTEYFRTDRHKTLHLTGNQIGAKAMIIFIFTVAAVISPSVHRSLPTTEHGYPLMHYPKLIRDEHFTVGRPLVIVLPLVEEDSTNKEVGYLIDELHSSGRWPVLVYNVSYRINGNMYTEIHQDGSYIILISGPCKEGKRHVSLFWQQLHELSVGNNTRPSWNPTAKYVVSVMSNCTHMENTTFLELFLITFGLIKSRRLLSSS